MGLVLDANGLYDFVKPPIDKSRASLGSAKDILSSIAIPGSFAYYGALKDLPTEIQVVQTRNDNVNVWLDAVVTEFGRKEEEAKGFEFNLFGLDVGSALTSAASTVAAVGTTIFETTTDAFVATGAAITGGFNTVTDFFETTGSHIVGATVSAWNSTNDWVMDTASVIGEIGASIGGAIANGASECWDWICGAAETTWGFIQSVGADIGNFLVSLIEGIASILETVLDLVLILGSAVGSIFTGIYDLGAGAVSWISGDGFQLGDATGAMWGWTMGFTAESWVNGAFDSFQGDTGVGQWLNEHAHGWFKSDGIACQIGQGVGYAAGAFALTVVTMGVVNPAVLAGGLAFSSSTTNSWAEMRDKSWEGIERAYESGDMDQETYDSIVAIKTMSDEDWQQIELMYQNGELPKEDYDAMLEIRQIPADWITLENGVSGLATGVKDGVVTGVITAATIGIGDKVMGSVGKVLPKLSQVAPRGVQTAFSKLLGNVAEEGTELVVELGANVALTGSLDEAWNQTGGLQGIIIGTVMGGLFDHIPISRRLAGNIDVDAPRVVDFDIPNTKFAFAESIKSIDDFKQLDVTTQSAYLKNCSIEGLSTILKDPTFSLEYQGVLNSRIIESQDYIFTQQNRVFGVSYEIMDIVKYTLGNEQLIHTLSNDNLVKLLARTDKNSPYLTNLVKEIDNRVAQGNFIFARYDNVEKMHGRETHDSILAMNRLPASTFDEIVRLTKESYLGMSDFIKDYDFGDFSLMAKASIGKLYNRGLLDETGFSILKEINDINPNTLKTFNFGLLNKDIIDILGKDYVMEMGRYPEISNGLISLYDNHPNLLECYATITAKSYADDSLMTFSTKNQIFVDFFVENSHLLKNLDSSVITSDDFINYMLYSKTSYDNASSRINMDFDANYTRNFALECDRVFYDLYSKYQSTSSEYVKPGYIRDAKEAFFQKYFSISSYEARAFIAKYGDYIDAIGNSENGMIYSDVLNIFKDVDSCTDMEYLKMMFDADRVGFNAEQMIKLDNSIKQAYAQTYVNSLSITKDIMNTSDNFSTVTYNGQEIKIINLEDDFSFLVYSSDSGFGTHGDIKSLVNDSYIDSWYQIDSGAAHGLSTSYITSSNIGSAPVLGKGVLYGFTNIELSNIAIMGPYDIDSRIANYGFNAGNKQIYIPASDMSSNTVRVYNEVVIDRGAVTPDTIILYDDATPQAIENAYKAAAEWNIPIVSISKVDLATSNLARINSHLDYFTISNNLESLKSAIDLYESNVSGFRLNANEVEGAIDFTASINNEIVADMFNSDKIESVITDYIDTLSTSSNTIAKGNELINILESVQKKYEVANANSKGMANTQSAIDLEKLINYTKEMMGGN